MESDNKGAEVGSGAEALRRQIDETDERIVALLNRRAQLAIDIGQLKHRSGGAIYRPDREAQVLAHAAAAGAGPLGPAAIRAIYAEVVSACRALEREVRVGYLGPAGTFTHEAALRKFGASATLVPCATIEEVFRETERGNVDYGVIAVENSTAGSVTPTLEAFLESRLQVCAEMELPIVHNLMSRGVLGEIRRVYSHPQSLAQCRRWLAEHLAQAEQVAVASNSLAVQMAETPELAAIGPEAAGNLYGVPILVRHIEDSSLNVTRFLVLGPARSPRTGRDKSAVVFSVKNRPGALRDALDIFARRGIDLTWIESRPSKRELWQYVFFVDLIGHPEDETVAAALSELEQGALFVKVLGAWPVESAA